MDNSVGADIEVAQVKFVPPLHEQRRSWGLEILRRDASRIGRRLCDLLYAADITAPSKHAYGWTRFEQLDVSMWEGSLQAPNPAFKGIECIIATEVYDTLLPQILYWLTSKSSIEHLPAEVVDTFAPVLLGNYAPRLLLFTTPCFDFNERFSAPGDDMWGFADPTGRTNRIFRHSDHKFEWTVDECVQWSKAAAEEWGYDVVIDGVGRSTTKDPWGRDSTNIYASQAVTFRRREDEESTTKRAQKYAEWASRRAEETQSHKLLVTHRYEAHVGAQKPAPREEIAAAVKSTIQEIASSESPYSKSGARTPFLPSDDSFLVHKEGKNADDWKIELPGVELQGRTMPGVNPPSPLNPLRPMTTKTSTRNITPRRRREYDGDDWDETEDSGWAVSDSEGWSKDESDVNTLKAWGEWRPAPGWIMEGTWD
ncbi:hypothetical protein BJV77DRAFT_961248 [Russula vinacea]|nr:hypothetical protein BJV77DRAFT_961248 [Russula vinacea]